MTIFKRDQMTVKFSVKDNNVSVDTKWQKNTDPRLIGQVIGALLTGAFGETLLASVEKHAEKLKKKEDLEIIDQIAQDFLINQKNSFQNESSNEDDPIVDPQNAIRHQMIMYQQG